MNLPSELCAVINQDRTLEYYRHQINWHCDYASGACESKPTRSLHDLQTWYFSETGFYWDSVNGSNATNAVLAADGTLTYGPIESTQDRSDLGKMWDLLEPLLTRMPFHFGVETCDQMLFGLEAIQLKHGGLTDDECWLYEILVQKMDALKLLRDAEEIEHDLADRMYRLQHPNQFREIDG